MNKVEELLTGIKRYIDEVVTSVGFSGDSITLSDDNGGVTLSADDIRKLLLLLENNTQIVNLTQSQYTQLLETNTIDPNKVYIVK